jgi:hypothetical protein
LQQVTEKEAKSTVASVSRGGRVALSTILIALLKTSRFPKKEWSLVLSGFELALFWNA